MRKSPLFAFVFDMVRQALRGGPRYYAWMGALCVLMAVGAVAYSFQVVHGLSVTGMSDHVSWGLYISNFTFLVGVAAAAVMLVLPTYVMHDADFRNAVLVGEGIAVGALIMCLCFVTVDMGGPERFWHLIPGIGKFNWPVSMLAWDIIVLNGYLALNFGIPAYLLFCRYRGREPNHFYVVFVILSVFWAVSIHLVTAFLYASQPGRPFWYNSLLGPRFLASAFCAGPGLIMIVLWFIRTNTRYQVTDEALRKLAMLITGAAQINLIMLTSELFKEFYHETAHSSSAQYMLFGLHGHNPLGPWIWSALTANVICTGILTIHQLRRNLKIALPACGVLFAAVWVEKGMGLIVPGFTPSSLGEVTEYHPTWVEILVTLAIWALGAAVVTVLVRLSLAVELGHVAYSDHTGFKSRAFYKPQIHMPRVLVPKVRQPRVVAYTLDPRQRKRRWFGLRRAG